MQRRLGGELPFWYAWVEEFDIPDAYFTSAVVARAVCLAMTGKAPEVGQIVPYYAGQSGVQTPAEAKARVRGYFARLKAARGG